MQSVWILQHAYYLVGNTLSSIWVQMIVKNRPIKFLHLLWKKRKRTNRIAVNKSYSQLYCLNYSKRGRRKTKFTGSWVLPTRPRGILHEKRGRWELDICSWVNSNKRRMTKFKRIVSWRITVLTTLAPPDEEMTH